MNVFHIVNQKDENNSETLEGHTEEESAWKYNTLLWSGDEILLRNMSYWVTKGLTSLSS